MRHNLIDHANATGTDVELEPAPDGTVTLVLVVYTDLPLADVEQGYDEAKLIDLIKAVQSYIREHTSFNRARLRHGQ